MSGPVLAGDERVQLCAFWVGGTEYAVDIMRIDEILQPQRVTPVPRAPAFVEGVMNVRGALVPVIDLRKRLGATGAPPPRLKPKWLVTLIGRRRVALVVDGVSEVVRVSRRELQPAPAVLAQGERPAVIAACGPPERTRLLLNVKALLEQDGRA